MVYLFVGYFVLWALTFGYLFFLGARQKQLQRDLERLRPRILCSKASGPGSLVNHPALNTRQNRTL